MLTLNPYAELSVVFEAQDYSGRLLVPACSALTETRNVTIQTFSVSQLSTLFLEVQTSTSGAYIDYGTGSAEVTIFDLEGQILIWAPLILYQPMSPFAVMIIHKPIIIYMGF